MSSKTDFAEDIRLFREAVTSSITPLLQQLEKELARISSISPMCHEIVAKKIFGKKHYKDPRFVDYMKADADQWIQMVNTIFKILSKDTSSLYAVQTESRIDRYRRIEELRANELDGIIRDISGFLHKIQNGFILEASYNYAKQKKYVSNDDEKLPLREDIVPFLSKIKQTDVILGDRIITIVSNLLSPQFRDYLLVNNYAEAQRCLPVNDMKIRPVILEVAALQSGLASCLQVYPALNNSVKVCRKIDENYFLHAFGVKDELPVFPPTSYDAVIDHFERRQDLWSKEEYLAILGEEKKKYTFLYVKPQNGEYFPGLRESCWYENIIKGIASAVLSCKCIDEQDEDLFLYLFFGYGEAPHPKGSLCWKDRYDSRKKEDIVRHPYELYYLLDRDCRLLFSP